MNGGYRGVQPKIHNTKLEHNKCPGSHPNTTASFYEAMASWFPTENKDENLFDDYLCGSGIERVALKNGSIQSNMFSNENEHPRPF